MPSGPQLNALFPGASETAALMRALDWDATPLGPPARWPGSLRAVVPIMLASRSAMRVLWGPERVLLYNDAYRLILGPAHHPSALGKSLAQSFPEALAQLEPLLLRVAAGEALTRDDQLICSDRHGFLEEGYFTLSYSPLADDDGSVGGQLGILHETTAQVIAARRLATLRELAAGGALAGPPDELLAQAARALAKNPHDVPFALFYLLEPDGAHLRLAARAGLDQAPRAAPERCALANAGASGWPFARAADASPVVLTDLRQRFGELISGAYPESPRATLLLPLRRAPGETPLAYFVAGVNPRRALDPGTRDFFDQIAGQLQARLHAHEERAERGRLLASEQAARAEAERSNQAKDDFLSIVSHELRNPLSAVLGWTRLLRTGKLGPEKREHALETIERNAVNQSQLIEDLLDMSRIISGKLRLDVARVSFAEIVRAAIESSRPALAAKQLRLEVLLEPDAPPLMGDAARLQQIVWNLLSNATKFTPRGGSVAVRLKHACGMLELEVEDSGSGIAPAFLPHLFGRFRLADASSTRAQGGLGVGLSIAKNLIEMHGGTISVQSEEGKGASFVVRLPAAPVAEPGAPLGAAPGARELELSGLNILVVDDEPDARELVAEFLEQCGARVFQAGSAQAALDALDSERPDVILSDIRMPGEDGFSLIERIRSRPADEGGVTPAASLTAFTAAEDRRRALLLGFNIHMQKPVPPAELVSVVAGLGRIARAARAARS